MEYVHRPEFWTPENTMFRTLKQFPFSGEGRNTATVLNPSERSNLNHRTKFRAMDEVHKPRDSEWTLQIRTEFLKRLGTADH
jgi:hypothetical protein